MVKKQSRRRQYVELTGTLYNGLPANSRAAMLASVATGSIASLVLLGWSFDFEVLKRIVPGLVAMNPVTAVTFLIAAFCLGNFAMQKRGCHTAVSLWIGRICALAVALVGASKLIAVLSGHDLHFDQWLFTAKLAAESELPNTIAPNTALNFLLIGCALFFLQVCSRRVSAWACIFALVCGFEALLVIIGYTYQVHGFYGVKSFIPMALHTVFCFGLLVFGIMSCQANRGFLAIILGNTAGGRMAQRLLPAAILVPAVLGWLRLEGQRIGLYDSEFGVGLYTVTNMLLFAAIVCCNAYSFFRTDTRRSTAESRLRRAHDELEGRVRERTEQLSNANTALQSAQAGLEERVRERTASLALAEARLHAIVDNATSVIYVKDLEGRFLLVNDCFEKLLNRSKVEIIGRTGHDLYPAASADIFRANDLAALKAGVPLESEETVEGPESARTFISSKFPLREISGEIYALCCVSTEITERKKAEDEIRQVHKFLDSVVENIPDMIFVKEAMNLEFVRCNKAGEQLLGIPRGQLLGKNDHVLFPKEQADSFTAQDRRVLQDQQPLNIPEEEIETARGTRILHTKKIPILDENGTPAYLLGVSTDITERKRAEDALHQSNRELEMAVHANELVMQNSRDVICTVDEAGRFATVSAASETVLGYAPAELIGRQYIDFIYPEDRARSTEVAEAIMSGNPAVTDFENRYVRKDGSLVNVLWSAYWSEADRTMFAVAHDITVRKEAESRLRFHRSRSAIRLCSAPLINEVLDISRIEARRLSLSREPVEIAEAMREVIDLMQPLATEADVRLNLSHPGTTYVLADRQRFKQVLLNLLSNAIKYNRPGGSVNLACEVSEDRVRISVRDTGIGIPREHLAQLFSPFERLGAEQGEIEGTGLGLTVTKRLVEVMKGTIGVESKAGEGSTFWIELARTESPLVYSELSQPPSPIESVTWGESGTVLYIEDNFSNLKLIERLFRLRPALTLIAARDGRSGLQMARAQQPTLILLDLNLPDINGRDVLTRLRAEPLTSNIPVITLSPDATPGQIERLMRAGTADYLTKPINVEKFLKSLDRTLKGKTQPTPGAQVRQTAPVFLSEAQL